MNLLADCKALIAQASATEGRIRRILRQIKEGRSPARPPSSRRS